MLGYGPSFREVIGQSVDPAPGSVTPRAPGRLAPAIGCGLGLLILATGGRAVPFTVGTVGGCTHTNLQSALDAAAANGPDLDAIWISADQVGHFEVRNQSVSLAGGYADCDASTPTGSTLLSGAGSSRVLDIAGGSGGVQLIQLSHLVITDGWAANGGGIQISGRADVVLDDTAVYGNVATELGGGVYVEGGYGARFILRDGSSVMSNSALNAAYGKGGGIFCVESTPVNASVTLVDGFIYDNEATTDGGGLYLGGCDLTSYSGGALRGIVGNRAGRGGGVYAKSGAQLLFFGNNDHPVTLDSNVATSFGSPGDPYGSAVRIEGTGTRLELYDSWVVNNTGADAIGARDADAVIIDRSDYAGDCRDRDRCSLVANNSSGLQIFNTDLTLRRTLLEENGPDGPVVYLDAGNRTVEIESSVFARNYFKFTRPQIITVASGKTRIAYSTFVDNLTDAMGRTPYVLGLAPAPGAHELTFVGNIVAETAGSVVDTFDTPAMWDTYNERFDCLIVHENASLPPSATAVQVWTDPNLFFADRAGHDYHLRTGSPAIDFCDTFYYTPSLDIDRQTRGFDDLAAANWLGPYDLGADERQPDFLFDTFETGDLERWSLSSP